MQQAPRGARRFRQFPRLVSISGLSLLLLFLAGPPCAADPPDPIALQLHHGPASGQVTLDWTGGSPVFEVYRAASPAQVVNAANKLGEASNPSWTDVPPPGGAHFYQVILRGNHPPALAPIGNQTAPQAQTLTFVVAASDPDGDPLTLTATPLPLPAHATFDGTTGQFSFRPTADEIGAFDLTFSASDGALTASETVTITVPAAQPGTPASLTGRVLDANSFANGFTVPIVSATISLLGTGRSALSDSQGNFTVTNVPPGHQVLDILSATAQPAPDGSPYAGFREAFEVTAGVENRVERPFFLPRIDVTTQTTVNPNATTVVTSTALGASLTVPPHTAKNPDGSDFTGQLSISLVPRGLAPAALPSFLDPALLITIQPVGVAFATPVPLTFPNLDHLPAGNDMHLWSLLATEGRFAVVGRGEISADGQRIETVAGGVRAADWHLFLPPQPMASGPPAERRCGQSPDGPEESQCLGSSSGLAEGALQEQHAIPGVRSLGVSRTLTVSYDSTTADVRPIVGFDVVLLEQAAVPQQFSIALQVGNVTQVVAAYYDAAPLPENADSTSRLVAQFNAASLPTGRYRYSGEIFSRYESSRVGAVVSDKLVVLNRRQSATGAGWGIAGVQRLHAQADGSAFIEDGSGLALVFEAAAQGSFTATAPMNSPRGDYPLAAPLPDGRVLVAGGTTTTTSDFPSVTALAEIFDPIAGTWTPTGSMHVPRAAPPQPVILRDGRILIAGGGGSGLTNSAEIYDPATGQFTLTGSMSVPRNGTATLLGDGTVLAAGGQGLSTAEIYDPVSGMFKPTNGPMTRARVEHTATVLPDGRVLIAGGHTNCGFPATTAVEIYDPATRLFTPAGPMTTPRSAHTATLLPDGQVLFTGGSTTNSCQPTDQTDKVEIYDPVTGTAMLLPDRLCSVKSQHTALALKDGRVLIAGGWAVPGQESATSCADLYDPETGLIVRLPAMTAARGEFPMVGLPDGRVLLAGGGTQPGAPVLQSAEVFGLAEQSDAFVTPAAEFSVLTRNPDGTFLRRYKDGAQVRFDSSGFETSVVDRNGNTTTYAYGPQGRLATMTDPVGQVWTLAYDAGGLLQSVTDPASRTTSFTHDARGDLIRITKPDGASVSYAYDVVHRLTRKTDERGNAIVYAYDFAGRLTSATHPDNEVRQLRPTVVVGMANQSAGGGTTGNPAPIVLSGNVAARFTDGNGHFSTLTLNRFGSATRREDPLGRVTLMARDANNLPTRVTRPNGSVVTMTYDPRGNLLTSTEQNDPNGPATTTFTYEPVFNQMTSITDPLGHTTTIGHDSQGNPTTITDARGKTTTLTYDPRGLLTSSSDPLTNTAQLTYDPYGNVATLTDPRGKTTTLTRDAAGNVTRSEDPLHRITQTNYDALKRITRVTDPLGGMTGHAYDGAGNLTTLTDAKNQTTIFGYNDRGLMSTTRNPLGQTKTYAYDAAQNLEHLVDAKGQRIEFTYDAADQLTRKVLKDAGASVTDTVTYSYDLLGNLSAATDGDSGLSFQYDALGRLSQTSTLAGPAQPATTVLYGYDKAGNRSGMTDPHGNLTTYTYDEVNRLTTLTSIDGVFTFGYDDAGRRTSLQFPNATRAAYDYDHTSQLTTLHYLDPSLALLSRTDYTYDDKGNRDSRTTTDGTTSYTYDTLDRLTAAVGPDPANPAQTATESYAYDAVGNRTSSHLATGQVHDQANRLLEDSRFTYAYDANGNLTSKQDKTTSALTTYDWDVENRLIAVHAPAQNVTFRYDPLGRRIEKAAAATTRYLYDQEDIVEELDGMNSPNLRYTHGPGIDEPLGRRDALTDMVTYYEADGLGSIADTTESSGQLSPRHRYDSYGTVSVGVATSGYAFTGREWDGEAGLYYYRARYYNPKIGRFLSEDPIRFHGGVNYFAYVLNNPVRYIDPSGLELPPSSTFGPHPPPGPPLVDVLGFWGEFINGARDMWNNFQTMENRNWIGIDKYYHCMANCEAASRGSGGRFASQVISELREDYGYWKGDPMSDSFEDIEANRCGRRGGESGRNCRQICAPFIPHSSPGRPPFVP